MKINHIGVAVDSIEEAMLHYEKLGFEKEGAEYSDEERKIRVQYIVNTGVKLELVAPLQEGIDSPVDRYLVKNRPYEMYHICYEVNDIDKSLGEMVKDKYYILEKPSISNAMGGYKTAYVFNKKIGLVELVEVNES